MKRIMKCFVVVTIMLSMVHMNVRHVDAITAAEKMVQIALKEEGSRYKKKYGSSPWCASFVSWAARSAGVSTKAIPSTSSTTQLYSSVKNNGGKVVSSPKRGDLVFYKKTNGSICHVAIMTSSSMSIHGNYSSKVMHIPANNYYDPNGVKTNRSRMIFVRPNYDNKEVVNTVEKEETPKKETSKKETPKKDKVETKSITNLSITGIPTNVLYTGEKIEPEVSVYDGSKKLTAKDITISYKNNTNLGKAIINIVGKGKYKGELTKTFSIVTKKVEMYFVNGAYGHAVVGFKKVRYADGYEIAYKKDGSDKWEYVYTSSPVYVFRNLKMSKKYSFKVRSYVLSNNEKIYGSYSKAMALYV